MSQGCRPNPPVAAGFPFQPLRTGAGGFIVAIDVANDGTAICGCDAFGAYVYNGSKWLQLCNTTALPSNAQPPFSSSGIYTIAICHGNSQVLYMAYGQLTTPTVFVSTNQGATWVATTLTGIGGNWQAGLLRGCCQHKSAIDPNDPDDYIIALDNGTIHETTNGRSGGSSTFSTISGAGGLVAASTYTNGSATESHCCIAFDPNSGTTSGRTNVCYIAPWAQGVYLRTTPTGTWTQVTGTAGLSILRMFLAPDSSAVYLLTGTTGNPGGTGLSRITWSAGPGSTPTVTSIPPGGGPVGQTFNILVDPSNATHITAFGCHSEAIWENSTNQGTTWSGDSIGKAVLNAADTPYLASGVTGGQSPWPIGMTNIMADPTSSRIWLGAFQGMYTANYPVPASPTTWNVATLSHGVEELATNTIVVPQGGNPILCAQDWGTLKSGFGPTKTNPDDVSSCPLTQNWDPSQTLPTCSDADWASSDPTFIIATSEQFDFGASDSALSTDGGTTWTKWVSQPLSGANDANGACVACSDHNNFMIMGDKLWWTNNGGSTFTQVTSPAGNASATTGWGNNGGFVPRFQLAADRVNYSGNGTGNPTFYAFHPTQGLFVGTVSGGTLSWTNPGLGGITLGFFRSMRAVGSNAGHLFLSGYGGSPGNSFPTGIRFYRTTNAGTSWSIVGSSSVTSVGAIQDVYGWDWGPPAPGHTYPSIYFYGFYNTGTGPYTNGGGAYVRGLFRSIDNCASFQQVAGEYPDGFTDTIKNIACDKTVYGRVFSAKDGSGFGVGQIVP